VITDSSGINSYRDTADDHDPVRGLRSAALRQLDRGVSSGTLPSRGAEIVEKLIGYGPDVERSWAARWVTETGDPAYRNAFAKLLLYGEQGAGLEFSPAEREAFDRVTRLKGEPCAMSRDDEPTARLRETVQTFLDTRGSFTDAASRMHVHKNTVHYRVRKAEEILGHPVNQDRLELEVALMACAQLGLGLTEWRRP